MAARLRGPGRRIEQRPDTELETMIDSAIAHCAQRGIDFYRVLGGIDAYMERRRRHDKRSHDAEIAACDTTDNEVMWGGG
jgi:hypothetical protein